MRAILRLSLVAASLLSFAFPASAFLPSIKRSVATPLWVSSTDNGEKPGIDFAKITEAANRAIQELPNYDAAKVQKNIQEGELGKRGELYVLAQGALIVSIVLGGIPLVGDPVRVVLGPLFLLAAISFAVLSFVDLGSDSLSPFPKPTEAGTLKTTGVYSQMRHPMYSSLMSSMLGLALITNSVDRLLLTGCLWYLLEIKSDKEEVFLMDQYGSNYAEYKVRQQVEQIQILNNHDEAHFSYCLLWSNRTKYPKSSSPLVSSKFFPGQIKSFEVNVARALSI